MKTEQEKEQRLAEKLKAVKELKAILWDCEQFVLTGSLIAELQGLCPSSKDIDITIVKPSEHVLTTLQGLGKPYLIKDTEVERMFILSYHGFKVDVFVREQVKYDEKLTYDGIIISPINRIVEAKKSYFRLKDLLQLRAWASTIFTPETIFDDLTSIQINTDYKS